MLFLNPWLLAGLAGATIPIIIHLVRQQAAKPLDWGAMRFLFDTISIRRRKMEWEDLLLMAARCLLAALFALALARPFLPPDSSAPWLFVLPAALVGIALCGGSFVLGNAKARWAVRVAGLALLALAGALVVFEKQLNLKRFEASGRRDVALVIDASASMEIARGGKTAFQTAIAEAKRLVKEAPTGTSFTVILGGPAPEAKTAAPLTHRADVLGILDQLAPIGGTFRAHDALGMATLGLAEGTNATKEIVVFTDGQRAGWRLDNPAAWDSLQRAWKAMPSRPKLLVRELETPADFRNLAISSVELSRAVVGTDREVGIRVTVENTGTAAITSGPVEVEIDGKKVGEIAVGLLTPGQKETLNLRHQFTQSGPQTVEARLAGSDDLASDNRLARVVVVRENLPVLLVDGNPAGGFFERASGYTALALAPSAGLVAGKKASEKYLMEPRVVAATALREEDLDGAAVIVLADVSRLPEKLAARLAERIATGAGLLVVAGPRAESAYYNAWQGADGPLMPMPLADEAADVTGISPAPSTFVHEALGMIVKDSDLATARVTRWRKTGVAQPGGVLAAAFSNGDAFLATRTYGTGRCVLATCAFDARSGNLPARRAFVPLVHELVTWAAGGGADLNVAAAWSPAFLLATNTGGLSGRYFRNRHKKEAAAIERIDPALDFDWTKEKPAPGFPGDNYSVVWTGILTPPMTGNYRLDAEVDDRFEITLDGKDTRRAQVGSADLGKVDWVAGVPVAFQARFEQESGGAFLRFYWTLPSGKRQLVPSSAFTPDRRAAPIPLQAVDPLGLPRAASIRAGRRGRELAIDGPAVPGIYRVSVGNELDATIPGIRDGSFPVSVASDPAESILETMTAEDLAFIRLRIDLLQPRSVADILGVLQGKGFGREIWKLLAAAAFVLMLLETALARWVSRSRRVADDVEISFGETTVWR
jgi:hypothetical protein